MGRLGAERYAATELVMLAGVSSVELKRIKLVAAVIPRSEPMGPWVERVLKREPAQDAVPQRSRGNDFMVIPPYEGAEDRGRRRRAPGAHRQVSGHARAQAGPGGGGQAEARFWCRAGRAPARSRWCACSTGSPSAPVN